MECTQIQKIARLPNCDSQLLAGLKKRLRNGLSCYSWTLDNVTEVEPTPVRNTKSKIRNRHFKMPIAWLQSGIDIEPPSEPSLYCTSYFFLKLLSKEQYKLLERTARALDGRKLRIGTTCSGCDIGVTAVKSVLKMINREFSVSCLQLCHMFQPLSPSPTSDIRMF